MALSISWQLAAGSWQLNNQLAAGSGQLAVDKASAARMLRNVGCKL
jgi:hypothetical protein